MLFSTKTVIKKVTTILVAFAVLFSGLPVIAGSYEAEAATPYWKHVKVKATASTKNTITWKKLTAKQRRSISGIAVYRGTTAKKMKLLKRIKKTSAKYVDNKAKPGKKYYYALKTYTKKGKSYRYNHKSPVKIIVTKTKAKAKAKASKKKDSEFIVKMSDAEYDIYHQEFIYVEANSSGKMTWSSSNTSVAEPLNNVTKGSNTIELKNPGKAIITVTNYDGQKKSAAFTVLGQAVTQLNNQLSYSYKVKFFCRPYTSMPNYFFLETDNPSDKIWDHDWYSGSPRENGDYVDIEVLDANGNDVSSYVKNDRGYQTSHYAIHLSPGGLFDDIQYTGWYIDDYNAYHGEIQGGYLGSFTPPSSGTYTIQIREYYVNGYDITATKPKILGKVNVLDLQKEYKTWMQQVIDQSTDASMTKPEKMQAICEYIVKTGHYPECLTNEAMDEYEKRYGKSHGNAYIKSILGRDNKPAFVCHCWDSYTSTYLLEDFGDMIDYPVRSMYWEYEQGSAEWASEHYYVKSVDDGNYYMACPVGKKDYDLGEIEMINPVSYQDYWLVLE